MPVTIERQRLLRTGDLEFSATSASTVDQYLVTASERTDKSTIAELFIAAGGNPAPRATLKQLGGGYLLCDRITVNSAGKNASLHWTIQVHWKEMESDNPQSQDRPTPNSGSINPTDWSPTWTKRTQVVFEPAKDAFYRGGYTAGELAHTHMDDFSPKRAPLLNSALQPFAARPEHRKLIQLWSFRWLRPSCPDSLLAAENKVNSLNFNVHLPGLSTRTWTKETALIDHVGLSNYRWGAVSLVEINVDIIVDPDGWSWLILDQGTAARAIPGIDPDVNGDTLTGPAIAGQPQFRQLSDASENPIQDPVLLNGDGQPLEPNGTPVLGEWMDLESTNFDNLPYIKDLKQ